MTQDERALLEKLAEDVDELKRAFFSVPPGSPPDEKPLIEALVHMWRSYQRGSWLARVVAFVAGGVTAAGGVYGSVMGWWRP